MSRAWDQSAGDMRRSFQAGTGSTWNGLADDARRTFARGWDQSADDMRQAFQRGATQASSSSAGDMRRDFGQAFDRSAGDMRDAFQRAARQAGGDMSDAMRDAGQSGGEQGGDAAGEGMASGIKGKAGAIAAGVGAAFAIAGGLAANQFIDAFTDALDKEKSLDLAQARLGVDEQTANRIGAAAGAAYGDAFGESVGENIDTARMAIQAGLLDPSATSQDIQTVISQLSGLNDFMGGDLQETAKAVGNLVKTGLVANTQEGFDVLAVGYRAVGLQGDDLVDSLKEYSAGWAQTGLDGKTAMALIAQSIDLGSDSTDRAADALREFGRRMYEESDTIKETLGTLGLPADELFDKLKGGGPDAVAAFDQIFDSIRAIEDPLDRANAAQALLGDTAGDFIGAFTSWDPSEAVSKFGEVAGAATNVLNTMGGNAATSIDSAKRSWELAMSGIGGAFAQVAGPELQKLADWISDHQPEVLGFLGQVADATLVMADGFLVFSSLSLRALGGFAEGAAPLIGSVVGPLGLVTEVLGKLTGNDDLEDFGKSMQNLDQSFADVASDAYAMADAIDNGARPKLLDLRQSVGDNIAEMQEAERVTRALGDAVVTLPNEHTITISENSPAVIAELEKVGIKVEAIPGTKDFRLIANTADGQTAIDSFLNQNTNRKITLQAEVALSARVQNGDLVIGSNSAWASKQADGGILSFADGKLPNQAMIAPGRGKGLVQWAEGETVQESFIPLAPGKRDRSIPIWFETGKRLGVLAMAGGGITSAQSWARGQAGKPYQYGGTGNPSWDCSGISGAVWASALGKPTNQRYFTTDSNFPALGWKSGPGGPNDISIGTNGGSGQNGHMATTVGGLNVESSGSDGVEVGAGALGASAFAKQFHWALGGDPGGSLGSGGANSITPGGGSTGGGGASTGGGTYGGQEIPAGVTPVWIVGGGAAGTSTLQATEPTTSAAASSSGTAAAADSGLGKPVDVNGRLQGMAGDFGNSNFDQFLGDLGFRREGGALQGLVKVIQETMAWQTAQALKQAAKKQESVVGQYGFGPR